MRRNFRKNTGYVDSKIVTFSIVGVVILATIVFGILMYGKNVNDNVRNSQLSSEQIASIAQSEPNKEDTESANTDIGKSIEEAEKEQKESKEISASNEINTNLNTTNTAQNTTLNSTKNTELSTNTTSSTSKKTTQNNVTSTSAKSTQKEIKKELSFKKPVEGEITQNFAKDSLIYSNTLDEWVTHLGIDIKAEKTTVVQSAEDGVVKSIKNDPRYGLTVVVNHQDGFETVYANLLSTEFVKEGDKVTKGQSIGTVGNTSVFESNEEPHLHFEILKDSTQVDPSIYLK